MAVCVTYTADAGCEFSKEETAYVSYQGKTPGDVLYLCLEDTFYRIQDRLFQLADEASDRLRFAVASCKLTDGLVGQLEDYPKERPGTRLIVIDTLQKVRTASKDNVYANDYRDISLLKDFTDRHAPLDGRRVEHLSCRH